MDRLNEEWDSNTEIEQIIRHRHIKYRRRTPGTGNYGPFAAYVTTRRIRLFVKFFNGVKQWIPMEAARNDNPIPLMEYATKNKLSKLPEWEWIKQFDKDELEDLRKAYITKFDFVPTKADLDLWIRKAKDGSNEFIASYVDDIIVVSKEPMELIGKFKETYSLKGIGTPEYYLGGNFNKINDPELVS